MSMNVIDPDSSVPKYLQICQWIEGLIETGRFKTGEKLPSEVELARMCEVNRNTLRQAMTELVSKSKVEKIKGVGSFVKKNEPTVELRHDLKRIASFKDYFGNAPLEEKTIVLELEPRVADKQIAEELVLGSERKILFLRRLRTGSGLPYIYEESHLPYNIFKDLTTDEASSSLYRVFTKKYGIRLAKSHQVIRAVNLNKQVCTMFSLPEGAAGFLMKNTTYDSNNTPVEVLYSFCRGDKYVLELDLGEYQTLG